MKRIYVVAIVVPFLSGCAQTYTWVKPGASAADFYQAKSYCEALSTGATPMNDSGPTSSTTYHSGSVYGSGGGYGTYSGTSTTYYDNTGQAFANLGKVMQRQRMFNDCMRGQGFLPEEEYVGESDGVNPEWSKMTEGHPAATINSSFTELRSDPSSDSELLSVLMEGDLVGVISKSSGNWLKVQYERMTGYVRTSRVTTD